MRIALGTEYSSHRPTLDQECAHQTQGLSGLALLSHSLFLIHKKVHMKQVGKSVVSIAACFGSSYCCLVIWFKPDR